ncbi:GumC family protein [Pseudohoeflea coraliihabitans]|uniref:Chain-length determining protein n=1 Tax=Pseudohoeflea coraliihabitans TaxID=2860393 RepID=A0ABS6WS52_9HYPH|nr:Wzz/FepE/Etk N-terminal domain-containing protein [Pseudohoeflea sp. DP4N28-3]MBW3098791.1 chain-length determining protein [Pseudohoeflea sp. DP4N28-3]
MPVAADQADVDIDLARLSRAIWQRKGMIALITLAAAFAAFLLTQLIDPLYKAETRILIAGREPVYASDTARPAVDTSFDERSVTSQVEILKSTDLIRTVAERLDLASRDEFDAATDPSFFKGVLVAFGLSNSPLEVSAQERVVKTFLEKLDVYAVSSSRIIAIEFSSQDPQLAADIANALADAYLAFNAGLKIENNTTASAWLAPEIETLRTKVREAEEAVARYRAEKGLLLVNERDTIAAKQLSDISTELSRVRGERADAEARARQVRSALDNGQSLDSLADVLGATNVQRLRQRESAIQAQLADLSATLLEGHPRMRALRAQLADIETQISRETQKVLAGLEDNARLARIREEELVSQINALKTGSAREGEEAVQLRELEREAAAQRDLLETYLARYRESASRSEPASAPADARVISQAVPASEPYFPKTLPIIVVAALAALLISTIWIMLAELLSGRALMPAAGSAARRDTDPSAPAIVAFTPAAAAPEMPKDQAGEPAPGAPVSSLTGPDGAGADAADAPPAMPLAAAAALAAATPQAQPAEPASELQASAATSAATLSPLLADPSSDFSIEAVANQLLARPGALAVSVSPEGDRASLGAVILARTAAAEGAKVLLVDMTGSGCPTAMMAESDRLPGLTDLLCNDVSIADAIHGDRLSAAQIVPRGNADGHRAMRAVDRLPILLDALVVAYDLVIVECGSTDAAGVERIAARGDAEVVLSIVHPDETQLESTLTDFFAHGFDDVLLMTATEDPDGPDRSDAVA